MFGILYCSTRRFGEVLGPQEPPTVLLIWVFASAMLFFIDPVSGGLNRFLPSNTSSMGQVFKHWFSSIRVDYFHVSNPLPFASSVGFTVFTNRLKAPILAMSLQFALTSRLDRLIRATGGGYLEAWIRRSRSRRLTASALPLQMKATMKGVEEVLAS